MGNNHQPGNEREAGNEVQRVTFFSLDVYEVEVDAKDKEEAEELAFDDEHPTHLERSTTVGDSFPEVLHIIELD